MRFNELDTGACEIRGEMTETNPYREPAEPAAGAPNPTYVAAWRRYRRLGIFSSPVLLIAGVVPIVVIRQLLGGDHTASVIVMISIVTWAGVFIASRRQLLAFRCPRCNRRFDSVLRDKQSGDHCAHCHLRRFALFDDRKEDAANE